jgi:hypothetical protein
MALSKALGTFTWGTADTVGTTQEITIGFEAKVIIFWYGGNPNTTDSGAAGDGKRGFGWALSTTNRRCLGNHSKNAVTTSVTGRASRSDAIVALVHDNGAGAETLDGLLDISAIGATSFTVIVDDQSSAQNLRISYLALGGSDITNVASEEETLANATGTQDFTGAGFNPADGDLLLFMGLPPGATPVLTTSNYFLLGAATSSSDEAVLSVVAADARGTTDTFKYARRGEISAASTTSATAMILRAEFSAWITDGFQLNVLEAGTATQFAWLIIKGPRFVIGDLLTQTDTTTTIPESGFGFQPEALMFFSHNAAASTQDVGQAEDNFSVGAAISATARVAHGGHDEDGVADTDISRVIEYDAVYINSDADDADFTVGLMDIQSIDSDGFTAIMDDADPVQCFVWYIAIGAASATTMKGMVMNNSFWPVPR